MHIGLIGGLGPAATVHYYRELVRRTRERGVTLELTMAHADVDTLLDNQARDDAAVQLRVYGEIADRLKSAGATCLVIPAIGGHFCFADGPAELPLPIIDIVAAVNDELARKRYRKVGILGTQSAMVSELYGGISEAEVAPLPDGMVGDVHDAYVSMAARGGAQANERRVIEAAYDHLIGQAGVDTVILGGTDLALVFDDQTERVQTLDCSEAHIATRVLPRFRGRLRTG